MRKIFLRHGRPKELEDDVDGNRHLDTLGLMSAITLGLGPVGEFARASSTKRFCSTTDRSIETMVCLLDPDNAEAIIADLRRRVFGKTPPQIYLSEERYWAFGLPMPANLPAMTLERGLYSRIEPEVLMLADDVFVVSSLEAGKQVAGGRELGWAEYAEF